MRVEGGQVVADPKGTSTASRRPQWLLTGIFVAACGIAFLVVSRSIDFATVLERLRAANAVPIAFAFVGYLGSLLLLCLRWHALVTTLKPSARFHNSVEALTASLMLNYASPGSVGVPARAILTRQLEGLPFVSIVPLAAGEALLDIAVLAAMVGVTLLISGPDAARSLLLPLAKQEGIVPIVGAVLMVVAIGAVAVWYRRTTVARLLRPSANALQTIARQPRVLLRVVVLAVSFWTTQIGIISLLFVALGQAHPLHFLFPYTVLPLLAGMVVPVPGGAGVREALMVGTAQAFGVSLESALIVAVLYRLLLFVTDPVLFIAARLSARGN